jgi:protein LSM14
MNKHEKAVEKDTDTKASEAGQQRSQKPQEVPATGAKAPPPPVDSKPDIAAALAPPPTSKAPPSGPKGRVQPAVPLTTAQKVAAGGGPSGQDAAAAAAAAVAAAMAKLPQANKSAGGPSKDGGVDNLTRKINELRADDHSRHQNNRGGYQNNHRGGGGGGGVGRGGFRGGRGGAGPQHKAIEVPATDFDFESANKKFNKQDIANEAATEGSAANGAEPDTPEAGAGETGNEDDVFIPLSYDKKSSFFDNISSELKDREENRKGYGGSEFRTEERKKNLETFGQGSVDNFRGGYRGRGGRGRGRGLRGNTGGFYRGGNRPRGGATNAQT